MTKCILLLLAAALPFLSPAQAVLFVAPGTSLTITSSTQFHTAGLTLVPGSNFTLNNVSLQKSVSLTHSSANTAISRSYVFNNATASFSGIIRVDYTNGELNGLSELLLQPNIHNGTGWQAYPSAFIDIVNKFVTSTSLTSTSLSEITLASSSTPLPVSWGKVSALRKNRVNEISWSASMENGRGHFDVEYSTDSRTWSVAVPDIAAQPSSGLIFYKQTDPVYKPQYLFYRVAETDVDGRVTYSDAVALSAVDASSVISVYPNPVSDRFFISGPQPGAIAGVSLMNDAGILVRQWSRGQAMYPVSGLARGVYIVTIKTKTGNTEISRLAIR